MKLIKKRQTFVSLFIVLGFFLVGAPPKANAQKEYVIAKSVVRGIQYLYTNHTKMIWYVRPRHTPWAIFYPDGTVIRNNFRSYRGAEQIARHYAGLEGDCNSWNEQTGAQYCYNSPESAARHAQRHGGPPIAMAFWNGSRWIKYSL